MIKKLSCPTFHQRGQHFWLLLIVVSLRISLTIQSNKDGRFELTVRDSHSTSKWKTRDKKTWTIDWSFPWWRDTREIERINVENQKEKKMTRNWKMNDIVSCTHTQGAENGSESIIKSFASLLNYFYFLCVCVVLLLLYLILFPVDGEFPAVRRWLRQSVECPPDSCKNTHSVTHTHTQNAILK